MFCFITYSQTSGRVIDAETNKPVSFANIWVEDEKIGTTSDLEGKYLFSKDLTEKYLIITAIGYKDQRYQLKPGINTVALKPEVYAIEEVVIQPVERKERIIGKFKKKKIEHYYSCGAKPWIAARYYPYHKKYEKTPFLKYMEIMTNSHTGQAIFGLRLMSVDESGKPGENLLPEKIVVQPEKGTGLTKVDLSKYNLKFPADGLMVATEFYVIDQNLYEQESYSEETGEKVTRKNYGPLIGNILEKEPDDGWVYIYGTWRRPFQIKYKIRKYHGKYWNIAAQITLTN
jgi:hypothetical protein